LCHNRRLDRIKQSFTDSADDAAMAKTGYTPTDPAVERQLAEWRASSSEPDAPVRFRALGSAVKAAVIAPLGLWLVLLAVMFPFSIFFPPLGLGILFCGSMIILAIRWIMKK
jgi:hypothetical protein